MLEDLRCAPRAVCSKAASCALVQFGQQGFVSQWILSQAQHTLISLGLFAVVSALKVRAGSEAVFLAQF
jgi:hypothetical protein